MSTLPCQLGDGYAQIRGPDSNGGPDATPDPREPAAAKQQVAATVPDPGDTRQVGELFQTWFGIKVDEVDALVEDARRKAATIRDQSTLELLLGHLMLRVQVLDEEVAELRKAADR
jgi:hypothetical protein